MNSFDKSKADTRNQAQMLSLQEFRSVLVNLLRFIEEEVSKYDKRVKDTQIDKAKLATDDEFLVRCDFFIIQPKFIDGQFFFAPSILKRWRDAQSTLLQTTQELGRAVRLDILPLTSQHHFINALAPNISKSLLGSRMFRYVCWLVYRCSRDTGVSGSGSIRKIFSRLKLFIFGISRPTTSPQDYPLHKAILEDNLSLVHRLLQYEKYLDCIWSHVDQCDPFGLTALNLAIRLGRNEVVKILCDNGANPALRPHPMIRTPIEEASLKKNVEALTTLMRTNQKFARQKWKTYVELFFGILEKMPDFTFDIQWECDSNFIPFAKRWAPSDVYHVQKRGSSVKMDMTLVGWNNFHCVRGNMSVLFHGRDEAHPGTLFLIDHEKKIVADVLNEMSPALLHEIVNAKLEHGASKREMRTEGLQLEADMSWLGAPIEENIEGWTTAKHVARGTVFITRSMKGSMLEKLDITLLKSIDNYIRLASEGGLIVNGCVSDMDELEELKMYSSEYEALLGRDERAKENRNDEYRKRFEASVWLAKDFPLNLDQLAPFLDILATVSNKFEKLKEFLTTKIIKDKTVFPLRAVIPLAYTLFASISFKSFDFKAQPEKSLFALNEGYFKPGLLNADIIVDEQHTPLLNTPDRRSSVRRVVTEVDFKKRRQASGCHNELDRISSEYSDNEGLEEISLEEARRRFEAMANRSSQTSEFVNLLDNTPSLTPHRRRSRMTLAEGDFLEEDMEEHLGVKYPGRLPVLRSGISITRLNTPHSRCDLDRLITFDPQIPQAATRLAHAGSRKATILPFNQSPRNSPPKGRRQVRAKSSEPSKIRRQTFIDTGKNQIINPYDLDMANSYSVLRRLHDLLRRREPAKGFIIPGNDFQRNQTKKSISTILQSSDAARSVTSQRHKDKGGTQISSTASAPHRKPMIRDADVNLKARRKGMPT